MIKAANVRDRIGPLRLRDEFLAEKFFEQRICSPLRDFSACNNRRLASLCELQQPRIARRRASFRGW
jgi:hypothetical protein